MMINKRLLIIYRLTIIRINSDHIPQKHKKYCYGYRMRNRNRNYSLYNLVPLGKVALAMKGSSYPTGGCVGRRGRVVMLLA